jgi:hypothetical protein
MTGRDTISVWDTGTGASLRELPGGLARFTPDGRALVTTGENGLAVIWDLRRETRSVDELAAIVAARSRWELVDGRLQLRGR